MAEEAKVEYCRGPGFRNTQHSDPCTCTQRALIDVLETAAIAICRFRCSSSVRDFDLQWEDMDRVTNAINNLQHKLIREDVRKKKRSAPVDEQTEKKKKKINVACTCDALNESCRCLCDCCSIGVHEVVLD